MVRHAPIHRRSGHSDIAICCGCNVRGSSLSTSVAPLSNQVTTLNHKRFKGFKMFTQTAIRFVGHLGYHDYEGPAVDLDERERAAASAGPPGRYEKYDRGVYLPYVNPPGPGE